MNVRYHCLVTLIEAENIKIVGAIFDFVFWSWPGYWVSEKAHENLLGLLRNYLILNKNFVIYVLKSDSSRFHPALYQRNQVDFFEIWCRMYIHIAIIMRNFDRIQSPIKCVIVQRQLVALIEPTV